MEPDEGDGVPVGVPHVPATSLPVRFAVQSLVGLQRGTPKKLTTNFPRRSKPIGSVHTSQRGTQEQPALQPEGNDISNTSDHPATTAEAATSASDIMNNHDIDGRECPGLSGAVVMTGVHLPTASRKRKVVETEVGREAEAQAEGADSPCETNAAKVARVAHKPNLTKDQVTKAEAISAGGSNQGNSEEITHAMDGDAVTTRSSRRSKPTSPERQLTGAMMEASTDIVPFAPQSFRSYLPRRSKAGNISVMQSEDSDHVSSSECGAASMVTSSNEKTGVLPSKELEYSANILSRIDEVEYSRGLYVDSHRLFRDFVLPSCFPWYMPRIAPLLPFMPRDIDDSPGIIHAIGKEEYSKVRSGLLGGTPHGVGFGYGRYETGRHRRKRKCGETTSGAMVGGREKESSASSPPSPPLAERVLTGTISTGNDCTSSTEGLCGGRIRAAARRSCCPGVIELSVALLSTPLSRSNGQEVDKSATISSVPASVIRERGFDLPTSGEGRMSISPAPHDKFLSQSLDLKRRKKEAEKIAELVEVTSCLPWYWHQGISSSFQKSSPQRHNSQATACSRETVIFDERLQSFDYSDEEFHKVCDEKDETHLGEGSQTEDDGDGFCRWRRDVQEKKRLAGNRARTYTKRYMISVRVHGVSSRESIFSGISDSTQGDSCGEAGRRSVDEDQGHTNDRYVTSSKAARRMRIPKFAMATCPALVQLGKSVPPETAKLLDEQQYLSSYLGSFECRWANPKLGEINPTTKRVQVGRTRLIWTSIAHNRPRSLRLAAAASGGNNVMAANTSVRVCYTSSLTGKRIEGGAGHKRPREVTVGVRVSGTLFGIGDEDGCLGDEVMIGRDASICRADGRNFPALTEGEEESKKASSMPYETYNWSNATCTLDRKLFVTNLLRQVKNPRRRPAQSLSQGSSLRIRLSAPLSPLMSSGEYQSGNVSSASSVSSPHLPFVQLKYGATNVLRHYPPRFDTLSMDDGPLRVVTMVPGSMHGSCVQAIMNQLARQRSRYARSKEKSKLRCSVCFRGSGVPSISDHASNTLEIVHECLDCGLPVHLGCCLDRGEILDSQEQDKRCQQGSGDPILQPKLSIRNARELYVQDSVSHTSFGGSEAKADGIESSGGASRVSTESVSMMPCGKTPATAFKEPDPASLAGSPRWRCSVCSEYNKKLHPAPGSTCSENAPKRSRRKPRPPSRYATGYDFNSSTGAVEKAVLESTIASKPTHKYRPVHSCSLCPHSGGAMSRYLSGEDQKRKGHGRTTSDPSWKWVHEVCRIWTGAFGNELACGTDTVAASDDSTLEGESTTKSPHLNGRVFSNINMFMQGEVLCRLSSVCAICGIGDENSQGSSSQGSDHKHSSGQTSGYRSGQSSLVEDRKKRSVTLVKCAARGCHVSFHPLCAVLVTRLKSDDVDLAYGGMATDASFEGAQRDALLCSQYTLQLIRVTRKEGIFGSLPGTEKSSIVPVAFCGWHNPAREPSHYGCPPLGHALFSAIRIPPQLDGDPEKIKTLSKEDDWSAMNEDESVRS